MMQNYIAKAKKRRGEEKNYLFCETSWKGTAYYNRGGSFRGLLFINRRSEKMEIVRDIEALMPAAQAACRLFLKKCKEAGLDIFVTETYRSQERQNALYEQGRSRPGQIVTWTKNSRHTNRLAWDIAVNPPKSLYDLTTLNQAGKIAASLGILWGGTWSTPDRPHFEVSQDWKAPEVIAVETNYQVLDKVPDWGKKTIQKVIDKGAFADVNRLDLSEDILRILVLLDRMGVF